MAKALLHTVFHLNLCQDLPLAEESFVQELESTFGRQLRPQKRGRKPKAADIDHQAKLVFEEWGKLLTVPI
jgi:hypothetical protein